MPTVVSERLRGSGTARRAPARLRRALPADLDLLVAHRRRMWFAIGGLTDAELAAADPVYRRWLRTRLRSRRAVAVIASVGDQDVGSAVGWLREEQPRPGAPGLRVPYVLSVFVEPALRGRGIASQLTAELLTWARGLGYRRTLLHASPFGRSVYRRLGFARTWEMRHGGSYRAGPERTRPADAAPASGDVPPRRSPRKRPR